MVMVYRVVCTSQTKTHFLEGRKREEWLVSLETGHVTNEDSRTGGEEGGGAGWGAWKWGMLQKRTQILERRKREERVGEPGNVARHKRGLTSWRGGRGRSRLVSL